MVIATFLGGIFMAGVQFLAQKDGVLENTDCNNFVALLTLLIVIGGVPSAALQTIFAQQAAAAVTPEKNAELSATTRALLRTTFLFWFVMAGLVMIFLGPVSAVLGVNDRAALRIAMMAALSALWLPTFKGVLQGMHRFASLGWLLIVEGAARLATFILLVILLKGRAAGGLWAVFAAQYLTLGIAVWLTRDVWGAKTSAAFSWRAWLIRGAPLTLGMGALIFISRLDNLFTKSLFFNSNDVKVYNCAMFIGFAITQFIAPITNVMFPTIVRNLALSRKTDALFLTLAVTGAFACLAALGCTLFPRLPVAILFPKQMGAAALVPWFAWALLPWTLANVLVQNLLARGQFSAAPWLILVPIFYGLALLLQAPALVRMPDLAAFARIIQTLGFFCLLLFSVAAWFTWRKPANEALDRGSADGR